MDTLMRKLLDFFDLRRRHIPKEQRTQIALIEKKIGYRFRNPAHLLDALKHRSVLPKLQEERHQSNERLEFLGDAVLDFIIAEYFYHLFPGMVEGQLTKLRSVIVSGTALTRAARKVGLGNYLILSINEERAGGRNRASILEDAFEALIGGIYLDGGLDPAREFVEVHLLDQWREIVQKEEFVNYKSLVLEHSQAHQWPNPVYRLIEESGPDHSKKFVVEVIINGVSEGIGEGSSKKIAEQRAASAAAAKLGLVDKSEPFGKEGEKQ
jgi:ribonuclease-3